MNSFNRLIIIFLLMLSIRHTANAQFFRPTFGVRAGAGLSWYSPHIFYDTGTSSDTPGFSFNAGGLMNIKLITLSLLYDTTSSAFKLRYSLQPEVRFSHESASIEASNVYVSSGNKTNIYSTYAIHANQTTIQFPLLLKVSFFGQDNSPVGWLGVSFFGQDTSRAGRFGFFGGPSLLYFISYQEHTVAKPTFFPPFDPIDEVKNMRGFTNSVKLGAVAGIEYFISDKSFVELRLNVVDHYMIENDTKRTSSLNNINLGFGYMF